MGTLSILLLAHLEQDPQRIEFVSCEGNLIIVDVRADQPQHELEIGLHKVQNDLIVVTVVVQLGDAGTGTRALAD